MVFVDITEAMFMLCFF